MSASPQPARLVPIHISDSGRALVLVRGFLSRRENTEKESAHWWTAFREANWRHSIYQLWWDASTPSDFSTKLLKTLLVPSLPLKTLSAASEALRHWRKVRGRAIEVGQAELGTLLAPIAHERLTLVGFSLGALLLHHGLVQKQHQSLDVERLIFLGGALSPDPGQCRQLMGAVKGGLINLYNPGDHVLRTFYRLGFMPIPDIDQVKRLLKGSAKQVGSRKRLKELGRAVSESTRSLIRPRAEGMAGSEADVHDSDFFTRVKTKIRATDTVKAMSEQPCGLAPIEINDPDLAWRVINSDMSPALGDHPRNHWHYWRVVGEALQNY